MKNAAAESVSVASKNRVRNSGESCSMAPVEQFFQSFVFAFSAENPDGLLQKGKLTRKLLLGVLFCLLAISLCLSLPSIGRSTVYVMAPHCNDTTPCSCALAGGSHPSVGPPEPVICGAVGFFTLFGMLVMILPPILIFYGFYFFRVSCVSCASQVYDECRAAFRSQQERDAAQQEELREAMEIDRKLQPLFDYSVY